MRFLRLFLVLAGCLHLCGGHYGVLQVIAWGGMIVNYSSQEGFVEGAKQTFDGKHPCNLCHSIEQAKKEDRREPQSPAGRDVSGFELKNLLTPPVITLHEPRSYLLPCLGFMPPGGLPPSFRTPPEMPPPRCV